jgi:putative sigma-54 modulation protein
MNVEYTGRHYEVTSAIRKEVETGVTKIRKILGDRFETKVVLTVEKHRHKAEITINPRNGPLVGLARAKDMMIAVSGALDHLEKQAVKYKTKWQSKKRSARKSEEVKKWNGHSPQADEAPAQTRVGLTEKTAVPVAVHRYPRRRQDHRSPLGSLQRSCRHAPHDPRRSHQRSPLPRP